MENTNRGLNKQKEFCECFFNPDSETYLNAYQSAIRSGYSELTARNIICRAKKGEYQVIQGKIKEFEDRFNEKGISPEFVLNRLLEILNLFDEPEKMKRYGVKASDIVKVLELLGKYLKMWTERIEMSGNVEITILPPDKK